MRLFAFDPDQVEELSKHLSEILKGDALANAVAAIDFVAGVPAPPDSRAEWRRLMVDWYARAMKIAKGAEELRRLLNEVDLVGLDGTSLDRDLGRLAAAAHSEAKAHAPRPGAGRPPDEWRDKLLATIYTVYPTGAAAKTRGSHFERTVEMVLEFLNRDVDDTHGLILDALRRCPEPPFKVTLIVDPPQ